MEVLSSRHLSRATLQRQGLLQRAETSIPAMVEHLVGLQAQNPLDPYFGLWARLDRFDPSQLGTMIAAGDMVRGQFMRGTIHLFGAEDARRVHPITREVLTRVFRSTQFSKDVAGVDLERLLAAGRELLEEKPRTRAQLANELGDRFPGHNPAALAQAITYLSPVLQVPPRGVWGQRGPAAWSSFEKLLPGAVVEPMSIDDLALRYLAAFGPAGIKDMRAWSGLTGLSEVLDRIRGSLRTYRDERGAELFDLADIELPAEDTPSPPRLLPEYDNVLLGHSDRSRFFAGDAVPRGGAGNVLVDGMFAGSWKVKDEILELAVTQTGIREAEALHEEAVRLTGWAWPGQIEEIRLVGS